MPVEVELFRQAIELFRQFPASHALMYQEFLAVSDEYRQDELEVGRMHGNMKRSSGVKVGSRCLENVTEEPADFIEQMTQPYNQLRNP